GHTPPAPGGTPGRSRGMGNEPWKQWPYPGLSERRAVQARAKLLSLHALHESGGAGRALGIEKAARQDDFGRRESDQRDEGSRLSTTSRMGPLPVTRRIALRSCIE